MDSGREQAASALDRETRKEALSKLVAAIEGRIGASVLSRLAGVSRALVRRWADHEDKTQIGVADAAGLGLEDRQQLACFLMGPGWMVVAEPEAALADSVDAACEMMADGGRLATEIAAAYRDKKVDRSEAGKLRAKAERVAQLAMGVVAVCDAADREGVIGLRVVGGAR